MAIYNFMYNGYVDFFALRHAINIVPLSVGTVDSRYRALLLSRFSATVCTWCSSWYAYVESMYVVQSSCPTYTYDILHRNHPAASFGRKREIGYGFDSFHTIIAHSLLNRLWEMSATALSMCT